jgi:hypothetical protein
MSIVLPANVAPASPVTYEFFQQFIESQAQETAALNAAMASIAGGFPGPGASRYLGWSAPVWHATSTASLTSTDIYVVAVYVPVAGTATYMDVDATTAGTVTVADVGLFSLAGTQLAEALTANLITNTAAWGAGINTWQYVTPAALTAGVYYATIETTSSAAPSLAASPASPVINYNLPANQYNYATYSTGTVPGSITPASLTGAVTAQPWVGIR